MNETERDSWRLRALFIAEGITALAVIAVPVVLLAVAVMTARGYGAPWWSVAIGLAFPLGIVARLVVHTSQLSNAVASWHGWLVEKVESS